jgi:hypothetical protein
MVLLGLLLHELQGNHVEGPELESLRRFGEAKKDGKRKTNRRCHGRSLGAQRSRGGRIFDRTPVSKLRIVV